MVDQINDDNKDDFNVVLVILIAIVYGNDNNNDDGDNIAAVTMKVVLTIKTLTMMQILNNRSISPT